LSRPRASGREKNGPIAEDEIGAHPEVDLDRGSNQKLQRDDRALSDKDRPDYAAGCGPAPAAIGDPTSDRYGNGSRNTLHPPA
jgi:hypothetical protein